MKQDDSSRMLLSFQVITDTHITSDAEHSYNRYLAKALEDVKRTAPESGGIMHVGDLTDHGFPEEYAEVGRILREHGEGLPAIRYTMGNHDVGLGHWPSRLGAFLGYTGMEGTYHQHWIDGYPFLFLGTELGLKLFASLSERQLSWLDERLAEAGKSGKPAFVFLHQPLKDTVAGSRETQQWYGVTQDEALKSVLAKHPQVLLFTGHTHWELESEHTMYQRSDKSSSAMFNAASVAYLWSDADEPIEGSQGYYVEVYADRVLVRGRDFMRGTWIAQAQFEVKLA